VETAPSGETPPLEQSQRRPHRKFFRWLVFFGVLIAIVAGAIRLILANSEPQYHGAALSKWLQLYSDNVDAEQQRREAAEAVRQIGPKAIPVLLKWAAATDSPLKQKVEQWADKLEVDVNFTDAEDYHQRAVSGFSLLGPQGKTAIPDLQRLLCNTNCVTTAARILCFFGSNSVPALLTGLTNSDANIQRVTAYAIGTWNSSLAASTSDQSPVILPVPLLLDLSTNPMSVVRQLAAQGLAEAAARKAVRPEIAVPLLIEQLKDSNRRSQTEAAAALAKFGPDARGAIPAMLDILKNYTSVTSRYPVYLNEGPFHPVTDFARTLRELRLSNDITSVRTQIPRNDAIVIALQALHAEPSPVIQTLQKNLESSKTNVYLSAINPLASYGVQAKTSVPQLLRIAIGQDIYVRTIILHAVDQIDTDAARTNLALAVLDYKDTSAIPYLTSSLASKDPFVRRISAYHLGNFGSAASTTASRLEPLLNDKDEAVRAAALEALKKIDPGAVAKVGVK
jgi:HEAT repeat protein